MVIWQRNDPLAEKALSDSPDVPKVSVTAWKMDIFTATCLRIIASVIAFRNPGAAT